MDGTAQLESRSFGEKTLTWQESMGVVVVVVVTPIHRRRVLVKRSE